MYGVQTKQNDKNEKKVLLQYQKESSFNVTEYAMNNIIYKICLWLPYYGDVLLGCLSI